MGASSSQVTKSNHSGSSSELHSEEAVKWFWGMGAVAIALTVTLLLADDRLTRSDKERRLADTLFELRSAQTTIPGRSGNDVRLAAPELVAGHAYEPTEAVKVRPDTAHGKGSARERHNSYFSPLADGGDHAEAAGHGEHDGH